MLLGTNFVPCGRVIYDLQMYRIKSLLLAQNCFQGWSVLWMLLHHIVQTVRLLLACGAKP